jgi:signal transduction histidine kinase
MHQVQAEDTIEAAHTFQQSIIDGVPEPIMVIGTDYRVMLMNRAAREFSFADTGTSAPVYCYQASHQCEGPCEGIEHPCPLKQVRATGQPVRLVHEHSHLSGDQRFVEIIAAPLWGADSAFLGIIESMRDVTERVRVEQSLQQYAERLRALTGQLAEVAEAERQRLARELHDQVGQRLTALGINLNIVRTQLPEEAGDAIRSRLDDSLFLVEQTTECIRDVTVNLRPPVLDDCGLVAALYGYAEQYTQRTGIDIAVEGEELVPRPATSVESALFRITQEALTNVAKHARAANVVVSVQVPGELLRLVIFDDGIGFDPAPIVEPAGSRGWGAAYHDRARRSRGWLLLD